MKKYDANNERIKKDYFKYQKEANQRSGLTVDEIRKSIARYEEYTSHKDFRSFNKEQAIGFKNHLTKQKNTRTNEVISKSTILHIINDLKAFFRWLAYQKGYKSKIDVYEVDYFNLSEKDVRTAKQAGYKDFPTVEQIRRVLQAMPTNTEIERRDRVLVAFTLLTGIRDKAITTLKLKHIDIDKKLVKQDPNEVATKFSKRIDTFFFPVGDDIAQIVTDWYDYLTKEKLYGYNHPLFPKTRLEQDSNHCFKPSGLTLEHWKTASAIRNIFKKAFYSIGLPYYNPHKFRDTLVHLGMKVCKTPEDFKAWSQNLGHENPLTTFTSYGNIDPYRQGELIRSLGDNANGTVK